MIDVGLPSNEKIEDEADRFNSARVERFPVEVGVKRELFAILLAPMSQLRDSAAAIPAYD